MPMDTTLKDALLNHILRTTAYTQPGALDIALFRTTGGEVTGTGYARESVGTADANWSAPAAGTGTRRQCTNAAVIDFGTAGSEWAAAGDPVTQVRVYEGATLRWTLTEDAAGNPISKIIQSGDPVQIQAGSLALFFEDGSA
jgi:hypothetical protein